MKSISKVSVSPVAVLALTAVALPVQAEMTANVAGRLQVDLAEYNSDVTELGSGSEMRRARFEVDGQIDEGWDYKLQIDFADGDLVVKDAYVKHDWMTLGQFKAPQSLETLTSSKYMTFIERPAVVDTFSIGRRIGAGADFGGDNWTAAVAVFGQDAEVQDGGKDEGTGFSGRVTFLPWKTDKGLFHVGAWAGLEEPQNTVDKLERFRARPESHVTNVRLIDTGNMDNVDKIMRAGLEGALVMGGVAVQGEYITAEVQRDVGADVDFDGYYVQASYLLGGNTKAYNATGFGRTKATRAWEFAIRYSNLDLTDTSGVISSRGGEQDVLTLGVNYYINPYLRVMANYLDIEAKNFNDGSPDQSPSALQFRISYDFK